MSLLCTFRFPNVCSWAFFDLKAKPGALNLTKPCRSMRVNPAADTTRIFHGEAGR